MKSVIVSNAGKLQQLVGYYCKRNTSGINFYKRVIPNSDIAWVGRAGAKEGFGPPTCPFLPKKVKVFFLT